MQDISMNFNGTEYKESSLIRFQIPHCSCSLRDYHLPSFSEVSKTYIHNFLKRLLKYYFLLQLHTCVRLAFLHVLQSEQHIVTDLMQKQRIQLYSIKSETLKKFVEM